MTFCLSIGCTGCLHNALLYKLGKQLFGCEMISISANFRAEFGFRSFVSSNWCVDVIWLQRPVCLIRVSHSMPLYSNRCSVYH
jgi:hypothetical protein